MRKLIGILFGISIISFNISSYAVNNGSIIDVGEGLEAEITGWSCQSNPIATLNPSDLADSSLDKFEQFAKKKGIDTNILSDMQYSRLISRWTCSEKSAVLYGLKSIDMTLSIMGVCSLGKAPIKVSVGLGLAVLGVKAIDFMIADIPCENLDNDRYIKEKVCNAMKNKGAECNPEDI